MILYTDENRRITSYNDMSLTPKQEAKELSKYGAVKYDGDFNFFMGKDKPGMQKFFYLNEDNTIRIEYTEIPPREPTFEERMESKADYIMMMQGEGGKDYA